MTNYPLGDLLMIDRIKADIIKTLTLDVSTAHSNLHSIEKEYELNEYENDFIWALGQLCSDIYCSSPNGVPFRFLLTRPNLGEIIKDLYSICASDINSSVKARIADFLWVSKNDYNCAKLALSEYSSGIKHEYDFEKCYFMLIRCIDITCKLKDKDLLNSLDEIINIVLSKATEKDGFFPYNIVKWSFKYHIKSDDEIISICNSEIQKAKNIHIKEEYLLLLEDVFLHKYSINNAKNKCCNNNDVNTTRRALVDLYIEESESIANNQIKITILKKALKYLRLLANTEEEREVLLRKIDSLGQDLLNDMHSMSDIKTDITDEVLYTFRCIDAIDDKKMAILFLLSQLSFRTFNQEKHALLEQRKTSIILSLVSRVTLSNQGKVISKLPSLDLENPEKDEKALEANIYDHAKEDALISASIFINPAHDKIMEKFKIDEQDILDIIDRSVFIPDGRKSAFIKGILAGIEGDFISALSILVPQVENAVRNMARECGDAIYSINENGIETPRTFEDILYKMPHLNECISEEILFNIKWIFESPYGFNMRNDIAHSLLDDYELNSLSGIYVWWAIFKICWIFSPIGEEEIEKLQQMRYILEPVHEQYQMIKHYDALIDENNDPVHDDESLKNHMNKWDGQMFINELHLCPDKAVLEIGVGTGRLACRTAPLCREFTGIDISRKTIKRAQENLSDINNISLVCDDFITYDFIDKFDTIYSSLTFMHIKDKQTAINKVADLLNSNGRFILSIDKNQNEFIEYNDRTIKIYPDNPENIKANIYEAGLEFISQIETESTYIIVASKK